MHVCTVICLSVCMYVSVHTYTHTHTYIHTYIHTYMYIRLHGLGVLRAFEVVHLPARLRVSDLRRFAF